MERGKQTGHICRWMALGITIATIVVGCTIVIGLFEWCDRSRMESRIAETHLWRKSIYDLNMRAPSCPRLGRQWKSIDRHIIVRFLINTAIQCNKFNSQASFTLQKVCSALEGCTSIRMLQSSTWKVPLNLCYLFYFSLYDCINKQVSSAFNVSVVSTLGGNTPL